MTADHPAHGMILGQLTNSLGAVLIGAATGMLLREDLGVHRPAPGRKSRADLLDPAAAVVDGVLPVIGLLVLP